MTDQVEDRDFIAESLIQKVEIVSFNCFHHIKSILINYSLIYCKKDQKKKREKKRNNDRK